MTSDLETAPAPSSDGPSPTPAGPDPEELKQKRRLAIGALLVAGAALSFLALGNIGDNLVYYWSPTELSEAGDKADGAKVRLGGLVEPGSMERKDGADEFNFRVTDGTSSVRVHASGLPPAMFREGIGILIEGSMGADGVFQSEQLMPKHDNEYRAPESDKELDMESLIKSMQLDES